MDWLQLAAQIFVYERVFVIIFLLFVIVGYILTIIIKKLSKSQKHSTEPEEYHPNKLFADLIKENK